MHTVEIAVVLSGYKIAGLRESEAYISFMQLYLQMH